MSISELTAANKLNQYNFHCCYYLSVATSKSPSLRIGERDKKSGVIDTCMSHSFSFSGIFRSKNEWQSMHSRCRLSLSPTINSTEESSTVDGEDVVEALLKMRHSGVTVK